MKARQGLRRAQRWFRHLPSSASPTRFETVEQWNSHWPWGAGHVHFVPTCRSTLAFILFLLCWVFPFPMSQLAPLPLNSPPTYCSEGYTYTFILQTEVLDKNLYLRLPRDGWPNAVPGSTKSALSMSEVFRCSSTPQPWALSAGWWWWNLCKEEGIVTPFKGTMMDVSLSPKTQMPFHSIALPSLCSF